MAGFVAPDFSRLMETEKVGWAGDWHGNTRWATHAIDAFNNRDVSIIYHVGDFGLWGGMDGATYLRKVQRALGFGNMILIVTPGNHENYDMLETFQRNKYGFYVRPDVGRIWYSPRGHVWTHHGAHMASLGGAGSIDRYRRTEGKGWWKQEEITAADVEALQRNMHRNEIVTIDVMMTHEAPAGIDLGPKSVHSGVPPEVESYCHAQRITLRGAVDHAAPRTLVHGHWHAHHKTTLTGVRPQGSDYTTKVIGLDMDSTAMNLMTGGLAPYSGILNAETFWK